MSTRVTRAYLQNANQRGDPNVMMSRNKVKANYIAMDDETAIPFINIIQRIAWSVAADPDDIDKVFLETVNKSKYPDRKPLKRLEQGKDQWKIYSKKIFQSVPTNYRSWGILVTGLRDEMEELKDNYMGSLLYSFNGAQKYGRLPYKLMNQKEAETVRLAHKAVWMKMIPVLEACRKEGMTWTDSDNPYEKAPFKIPMKVVDQYKDAVRQTSEAGVAERLKEIDSLEGKLEFIRTCEVADAIQIATIIMPAMFLHFKEATLKGKKLTEDITRPVIEDYGEFVNKVTDIFGEGLAIFRLDVQSKMDLNYSFSTVVSHMHWFFDAFRRMCNGGGDPFSGKEPREFEAIQEMIKIKTKEMTEVQKAAYEKMRARRTGNTGGKPTGTLGKKKATVEETAPPLRDWSLIEDWTPQDKLEYLWSVTRRKPIKVDALSGNKIGYINAANKFIPYGNEEPWNA